MRPRRLWTALLACLVAAGVDARLDDSEQSLRAAYALDLRWDNLEGAPYWLDGQQPRRRPDWGMHGVELAPGQSSLFRVPAGALIRIQAPDRTLSPADLELLLADGSGLAAAQDLIPSEDGHALLVQAPAEGPGLALVRRPRSASGPLSVALFLSRQELLADLAPYREVVGLSDEEGVVLRRELRSEAQRYWPLAAQQPVQIQVLGPARLLLVHRVRFPPLPGGTAPDLDYRIRLRIDDQEPRWESFSSRPDLSQTLLVNGVATLLGGEEKNYLELPAGGHRLEILADQDLYARLQRRADPDYLVPALNQPRPAHPSAPALAAREQRALDAARDNSRRGGGLAASADLAQAAGAHPEYPPVRQAARRLAATNNFVRELTPHQGATAGTRAWFLPAQLLELGEQAPGPLPVAALREALLQQLRQGRFFPLPPNQPREYRLPEREAPSQLLIALARPAAPSGLWVQYDQGPPRRLETLPRPQGLADRDFAAAPAEAALAQLQEGGTAGLGATLDGAFAGRREPAPLIDAAQVSLPLPKAVRQLRVWQDQDGLLDVAVSYFASQPQVAAEASYRALLEPLGRERARNLLLRQVRQPDRAAGTGPAQALLNDWWPLLRQIRTLAAGYGTGVPAAGPQDCVGDARPAPSPPASAGSPDYWLARLEQRAPTACRGGAAGEQARLEQAEALLELGEDDLAEALLRQLVLQARPNVRDAAAALLEARHRLRADATGLLALAAAALTSSPDSRHLARLAAALAETGQLPAALKVALLLPDAEQPRAELLPAALAAGWPVTAKDWLAATGPDPSPWTGWLAERDGDPELALDLWRRAGGPSQAWIDALTQGRALREQWTQGQLDPAAWQAWWQSLPGPWNWADASYWVQGQAGGELYYNPERDTAGHAYRAEPGQPLRLGVLGPTRLRLRVRPLLAPDNGQGLDGWLETRDGNRLQVHPLTNIRPAEGLTLASEPAKPLGREVIQELQISPGWHQIQVGAGDLTLAIQVDEWQPLVPLSVLPPPRPRTWTAASPSGTWFQPAPSVPRQTLSPAGPPPGAAPATSTQDPLGQALAQSDHGRVLALPAPDGAAAEARMAALVYILERDPAHAQAALAQAEALWWSQGQRPLVNDLWQRTLRHSHWQPVVDIESSAGTRTLAEPGWNPGDPFQRTRRALMEPTGDDEWVLNDARPLILFLRNQQPMRIELGLRPLEPQFLTPAPLEVAVQLDDQTPQPISLEPRSGWKTLEIPVPPGEHDLRISLPQPLANQFLRLRVREGGRSLVEPLEQTYQVATQAQPLRLQAQGPAWMRVERRQGQRQTSGQQPLAPGWQPVSLTPRDGEEELLRPELRLWDPAPRPARTRDANRVLEPLPATDLEAAEPAQPAAIRLQDRYALGSQEDGTWSFGLDSTRRSNFTEDASGSSAPEQFLELHTDYRFHAEPYDAYHQTRLLVRQREVGANTLGLKHLSQFQPWNGFLFARLESSLFAQEVSDGLAWSGYGRASLGTNIVLSPKTSLIPSAGIFGRYLSLEPGPEQDLAEVDQDVYTEYKDQHRAGANLSLEWHYRPWLDSLWYAGAGIVYNQDFNLATPDHFSYQVGASQLLGPLVADLSLTRRAFRPDGDRLEASNRDLLGLELGWNLWRSDQTRLELSAQFVHDFSQDSNLGMLSINWHGGEGRGLRDFRPGELRFRDLQQRDMPHEENNRVSDVPGY